MDTSFLIKAFAEKPELPIDVNDVLALMHEHGCEDEVEFIGVDLDPEILQGKIKIFHLRNGVYGQDVTRYANIYYHRGHSVDWQRFICCKELIHLLDPPSAQTNDLTEIDLLAERIGLPPEMQDPATDGIATNVDRLAEWRAAAILLPFAMREQLMPAFRSEVLTIDDIARMADIPRKYVGFIMSPVWEKLHTLLAS